MLEMFDKVFGILLFSRRRIITNVEDKLNEFSSHFDRQNTAPVSVSFPVADSQILRPFTVEEAEARKQDSRKMAGPDGVSTETLKGDPKCNFFPENH